MKLNNTQIRIELAKLNKNYAWLAKQLGISRQLLNYILNQRSLDRVDKMAKILSTTKDALII